MEIKELQKAARCTQEIAKKVLELNELSDHQLIMQAKKEMKDQQRSEAVAKMNFILNIHMKYGFSIEVVTEAINHVPKNERWVVDFINNQSILSESDCNKINHYLKSNYNAKNFIKEWITSDLHFFHNDTCGEDSFLPTRRFYKSESVSEKTQDNKLKIVAAMNKHLVEQHNKVVLPEDVVYILGDLALNTSPKEVFDILCQLNGYLIIVKGNHDSSKLMKYIEKHNFEVNGRMKFETYDVGLILKRYDCVVHLTHYMLSLGKPDSNLKNLHGHIHEKRSQLKNTLNIGVDSPENPNSKSKDTFGQPMDLNHAIIQCINKSGGKHEHKNN